MEEADLLKERLQAITDKRRIQEDIAKKRRLIEEEKLKLQYIKKKALREQWLMDGLSQQSEEEQEAMRIQAEDEQQQSDQLQSNILRIEKEIETLEIQELNISANEEVVLKRLKEVEKTPQDIIKDLNTEFHTDATLPVPLPIKDVPSFVPHTKAKPRPVCETESEETKKATFAIKICVEHDKRTGKNQVLSTATVSPQSLQQKGFKVFDDGRKSVYALQSESDEQPDGAMEEMTPTEVEELLHQATDEKEQLQVQYHQPVYSVPYVGTSRASTPKAACKTLPGEKTQHIQDMQEHLPLQRIQQYSTSSVYDAEAKLPCLNSLGQEKNERNLDPLSDLSSRTQGAFTSNKTDACRFRAPVPFTVRSEGTPVTRQPVYRPLDGPAQSFFTDSFSRHPSICSENAASVSLNTVPEGPEPESVTMIFMGYENAVDEDDDVQAELVMLDNSEDEDDIDSCAENESDRAGCLSYHPEGCKSKILLPKVGIAKVTAGGDVTEDAYTKWEDSELHKPTFIHKSGKNSVCLQRQRVDEPANTGSISMMKMDLCSAVR